MKNYPVPKLSLLVPGLSPAPDNSDYRLLSEQSIKRSRFLASVGRAKDRQSAKAFVDWIKALYPDATHNCWAYNAGPPGDTGAIGQSDDGEPHGTAGKPILNQILHYPGGETVLVVTRYFGGIKLGSGGLVRAYQSSAALALQGLELELFVNRLQIRLCAPIAVSGKIHGILAAAGAEILKEYYTEQAFFDISLNETELGNFEAIIMQTDAKIIDINVIS